MIFSDVIIVIIIIVREVVVDFTGGYGGCLLIMSET